MVQNLSLEIKPWKKERFFSVPDQVIIQVSHCWSPQEGRQVCPVLYLVVNF